jgi:hypothetical protein
VQGDRLRAGWTAKLVTLDLCAAIVGFGAARDVNELVQWLREEVPARAKELTKAVAASKGSFSDVPPCSCLSTPSAASWH